MIPLFKVRIQHDAEALVNEVLKSGYVAQGPRVAELETALKQKLRTSWAATVNSGTSALHLALHIIKARHKLADHEILTVPLTCAATNFPILANGLNIRWVDVDPRTCNMCLDDLATKLGPKTGAVMLVHWGGYPVDVARVKELIREKCDREIPIIEDCAHAFGTTVNDTHVGTQGTYGCFSFQAIKTLTTGDGGLLICPDNETNMQARRLRWFGLDRDNGASFRGHQDIAEWGYKFQMNDLAAAIGLANLRGVDSTVWVSTKNAMAYQSSLSDVPGVELFHYDIVQMTRSSNWLYTIKVQNRAGFIQKMKDAGIEVNPVHSRNDKLSCLSQFACSLPQLDKLNEEIVCLPVGWWINIDDQQHIISTIRSGW